MEKYIFEFKKEKKGFIFIKVYLSNQGVLYFNRITVKFIDAKKMTLIKYLRIQE